ncbi:hypothetical protein DPMN_193471 [Dreissena polymorpha]|uniref:Transposase Tc1-like domain-containing protein n=1 Tax=Dreissena polymorpha TaxID=45954 RepID=A0A9D4BCR8_DREPO|nr:hypothetical protein DPMN_193471 [Dreissena polymorpha]
MNNRHVTPQTVRNRLRAAGRSRKVPILTHRHRRARPVWARQYLRFSRADLATWKLMAVYGYIVAGEKETRIIVSWRWFHNAVGWKFFAYKDPNSAG